jgi:hypothetical protein
MKESSILLSNRALRNVASGLAGALPTVSPDEGAFLMGQEQWAAADRHITDLIVPTDSALDASGLVRSVPVHAV